MSAPRRRNAAAILPGRPPPQGADVLRACAARGLRGRSDARYHREAARVQPGETAAAWQFGSSQS